MKKIVALGDEQLAIAELARAAARSKKGEVLDGARLFAEGGGASRIARSGTRIDSESAGANAMESQARRAGIADQLQIAAVQVEADWI